jgi:hypothetical protein
MSNSLESYKDLNFEESKLQFDSKIKIESENEEPYDAEVELEVEEEANSPRSQISNNEDDGGNADSTSPVKKARKKRRTKDEKDGRNYLCDICHKAYLSYPALTNHKKTKHIPLIRSDPSGKTDADKKTRGRPKKMYQGSSFLMEYENKIKNFFDHDRRKPVQGFEILAMDSKTLNTMLCSVKLKVLDLLNSYLEKKRYTSCEEHAVMKSLIISEETETDNNCVSKNKTIDEVFISFIRNSTVKTNVEYLHNLILYCLLFHESINFNKSNPQFTSTESSQLIPEMCNNFIIFLTEKNYFKQQELEQEREESKEKEEIKTEINPDTKINSTFNSISTCMKIDIIEYIQYFCHWCYVNGYTAAKLSLIFK